MTACVPRPSSRRISRRLAGARGAVTVEYLVCIGVVALAGVGAFGEFYEGSKDLVEREASCATGDCGPGATDGGAGDSAGEGGAQGKGGASSGSSSALYDFGKGVVGALVGIVTGTVDTFLHPIDTVAGIGYAITHPGAVWDAVKGEWSGRSTAENLGYGLVEVVSLVGPAALAKVGRGAELASRAAEAARLADATRAAAATRWTKADRLGNGSQNVAYRRGDLVVLRPKGEQLDTSGQWRLMPAQAKIAQVAATAKTIEFLRQDARLAGIITPAEVRTPGQLTKPFVEGRTFNELTPEAKLRAETEAKSLVGAVHDRLQTPGAPAFEDFAVKVDRADIDARSFENFRFKPDGSVEAWIDPVSIIPRS
jgi:hypothetical protein